MNESTGARFHLSWAECKVPLRRAALALWLPSLAAFPLSPLAECGHCVQTYWGLLPVFPGLLAGLWTRDTVLLYVVAGIATLLVLATTALGFALCGRHWRWAAAAVMLPLVAQSIALGNLLRM